MPESVDRAPASPPLFSSEEWYEAVGGRSIRIRFEGAETGLFPKVVMPDPPPPVDLPSERRHFYLKLNRP